MEIVPITDAYWCEESGEMIDIGVIIGYEARGYGGTVLGSGESITEAINAGLIAKYMPELYENTLTNGKLGSTFTSKKSTAV